MVNRLSVQRHFGPSIADECGAVSPYSSWQEADRDAPRTFSTRKVPFALSLPDHRSPRHSRAAFCSTVWPASGFSNCMAPPPLQSPSRLPRMPGLRTPLFRRPDAAHRKSAFYEILGRRFQAAAWISLRCRSPRTKSSSSSLIWLSRVSMAVLTSSGDRSDGSMMGSVSSSDLAHFWTSSSR